jgi:transcription elongation factor GreA
MATNRKKTRDLLTKEGFEKLVAELEERKSKQRVEIANKLELATEQGDLSENAAYKAALEEKELNESRIEELEHLVLNAHVSDEPKNSNHVGLGDTVVVKNLANNKKFTYIIVGRSETDPKEGKISLESPIGKAFFGKSVGDKVTVSLPTATIEYKLEKIN